jgi:molybdopterin-biosynthesis enzyme MoeA-like protein
MAIGLVIIGTELLTGKRRDGHLAHAIDALAARALELAWSRYLRDDPALITRELRFAMESRDIVFVFGGIGATPDDHTRACAAEAARVALGRHPEAAAIIEERFGDGAYPRRIHMADLPVGATLIPNPVNRIPGFTLGRCHFVPGFPQMAWPMMEWVLDRLYPELGRGDKPVETLLVLPDASEGELIDVMRLPHMDGDYRETELGVRGSPKDVDAAVAWLETRLERGGWSWQSKSRG